MSDKISSVHRLFLVEALNSCYVSGMSIVGNYNVYWVQQGGLAANFESRWR